MNTHTLATMRARIDELEKACASALSVIEGMRASSRDIEAALAPDDCDDSEPEEINEAHLFGAFTHWRQFSPDSAGYDAHCIIEWPDLDLAAQDLRKVLGWALPHRECGHSACGQNFIDTGETGCIEGES